MTNKRVRFFVVSLTLVACQKSPQHLTEITEKDIAHEKLVNETLQEEILQGDLVEALENEDELQQRGFILNGIIKRLLKLILPEHLRDFSGHHPDLDTNKQNFAEYKGVFGRCHQFRVFYKYQDSRIEGVRWASSVLSVPARKKSNTYGAVVLAPTLEGFTPFVESGLWLKLCRKGIATLMPESLYRKKKTLWQKIHFDPTPEYKSVDEFSLYEESIVRYENVLNQNIKILKNFDQLKTDHGDKITDLKIMTIHPKRVGFWGSSFGAVVGALVVAKDPQLKAAVLTVGGGDLPYVIAHSKISLFKDTRREQMRLLGIDSLHEYKNFIGDYIKSEPLKFAKKSDSNRLYMILAKKDRSVPTVSQYRLFEKFGRPQNSRSRGGHVRTLLFTSWINTWTSRRSIGFLIKKLEQEPINNQHFK